MRTLVGLSAAAATALLPISASAFRADNYMRVNPVGPATFEVINRPGKGPSDFWCAAGDFVRGRLSVPSNQRVYIVRGRGPSQTEPGRSAVIFSLQPPAGVDTVAAAQSITLSTDRIGDNLSVALAVQYCLDLRDSDDPFTFP
ncbi:hypothetical protein [Thalassococcus sp. S3]|uniref:hypothetical protein n=1 Tax=Thalassococcus sp. S3 TaxID=2017482 RepID=UPI00102448D3|nr:hypothetical protein [Thalassococcus sp. S3]QBF31219.1 hypothetical protein CFI11_08310 [Thalassococcus sp. S3]